jgi:ribonuclease BN (tRNA processing enzyme)
VLELCDGVDLLIHDSQYTNVDWETKSHWGHCTVDYALDVAIASKAKTLCLFHHDPSRTDTEIDKLTASLKERAKANQVDVFAAAEGLTIEVGRPVGPQIAKAVSVGPMFSSNC